VKPPLLDNGCGGVKPPLFGAGVDIGADQEQVGQNL